MRQDAERRLLFIQNCLDATADLAMVPKGRNLLDGDKAVSGALSLEPYGCAIIELV